MSSPINVQLGQGAPGTTPWPVTDTAAEATLGNRFAGGLTSTAAVLSAAGNNTLITPPAGKSVRLQWVSMIPDTDNATANLVTVQFLTSGQVLYIAYAMAHWELFTGNVNEPLTVTLANAQPVAVTAHWKAI